MKVAEIMSEQPLTVSPADDPRELERLAALGRVRHVPIVEEGRLVGMWVSTGDEPIARVGPEEVHQMTSDAPAEDAIAELLAGKQAVVVWEGGAPVGVVTKSDVLNIVRAALARGIGRRHRRPIVFRLVGPASADKTALLLRTVPLLRHCSVGIVQADENVGHAAATRDLAGARVVTAPSAQFRTGLRSALAELQDAQVVLFEDRDSPPGPARAIGEDYQVLVVSAAEADGLGIDVISEASAVVVTKLDEAPPGFDIEALRSALAERPADVPLFGVAATADDPGLLDWRDWLLSHALPESR